MIILILCVRDSMDVLGGHLIMESDSFDVIKDIEEVGLDGVGVRGLAQDLQQGRVRHKEEARKQQALLLQIAVKEHVDDRKMKCVLWFQNSN